jgi:hypothetical protein
MMTSREFPIEERPAVSANGTVKPSDSPMILRILPLAALESRLDDKREGLHVTNDVGVNQSSFIVSLEFLATNPLAGFIVTVALGREWRIVLNARVDRPYRGAA